MVLPGKDLFEEEFTNERVCVIDEGEDIYMDLMNDESYFSLHQVDHRQYENYSTATSYMGQSCNERNFVNSQGLKDEIERVLNGLDLTVYYSNY